MKLRPPTGSSRTRDSARVVRAGWVHRAAGVVYLLAMALLTSRAAHAQRLIPAPPERLPFDLDMPSMGPIEESGALVAFGRDRQTASQRSVRVDGASVTAGPGIASDHVANVISCAGARWLLELNGSRWWVHADGAAEVWHSPEPARDVQVQCVAGRVVVADLRAGEWVTQVLSPTVAPPQRIRIALPGVEATAEWAAVTPDELFVLVRRTIGPGALDGATELLRVVGGRVTHRLDLGAAGSAKIATDANDVLVAMESLDGFALTLRRVARRDLASGTTSTVRGAAGHGIQLEGIWPGPAGNVAVSVREGWTAMSARYWTARLLLWTPAAASLVVGDAIDLGTATGAMRWLGSTLVLVQGAHAVMPVGPSRRGSAPRVDHVDAAVVRRFTVGR